MAKKFDAMHEWLGISPSEQPPCHYRLLGIERYESSPKLIEEAVKKLKLLLQNHAKGNHVEDAKQLYEEIKKAKKILLNDERKAIYDRLLAKGSRKKFVAPSRSARNHKLEGAETGAATTNQVQHSHVGQPVMSTGLVLACLGAMFMATFIGVALIVLYSQRSVTPAPAQLSIANASETRNEPASIGHNKEVLAKTTPSNPVSRLENTSELSRKKPESPPSPPVTSPDLTNSSPTGTKTDESLPVSPGLKNESPSKAAEGMPPDATAHWEQLLGLQGVLQGQVQMARESRSGKTRYLYFSSDQNDIMVFLLQRKVGDQLSLDYLKGLEGKKIRVRGKVQREFGSNRMGLSIQNESQIEILD